MTEREYVPIRTCDIKGLPRQGQRAREGAAGIGFTRGAVGVWDTRTTGWRPRCDHDGEPIGGTVLDPFFGAGTVGLVAESLGRSWVGIELSQE